MIHSLIIALCFAAVFATPAALTAQAPSPSPHWGAEIYPRSTPGLRGSLTLDRFTEFDSNNQTYKGKDTDETIGFNLLSVTLTDYLEVFPDFTYTATLGAGLSADQPTKFLQNEYVHDIRHMKHVPVQDRRNSAELVAGLELNYWFDLPSFLHLRESRADRLSRRSFLGVGYATGTIYEESFLHIGHEEHFEISSSWKRDLHISILGRACLPHGADAFSTVDDFSVVSQATVSLKPTSVDSSNFVWNLLGNPEIGVVWTYDSGLFVDRFTNKPIDTRFVSFYFEWATGLRIGTYNDMANNSDIGPSMGVLIGFDLMTLARSLTL